MLGQPKKVGGIQKMLGKSYIASTSTSPLQFVGPRARNDAQMHCLIPGLGGIAGSEQLKVPRALPVVGQWREASLEAT